MISKKQVIVFGQKVLEEKIATAMLLTMLTLPFFSLYNTSRYFIDEPLTIIVMLVTTAIVIPNVRVYIAKYSKYIKNILAIFLIGYGITSYFANNYGHLKIGGDFLVILSILLIVETNPIIINSAKKWWKDDQKDSSS